MSHTLIVTVRGMPRVKKNSRRILKFGNKHGLGSSEGYATWEASALTQLAFAKKWTGQYPVYAHYFFFVKTRAKFDLSNMCEGINDVMQTAGVIADDDYEHLIPVFHGNFAGVGIDKENPRVVVLLADKPATK